MSNAFTAIALSVALTSGMCRRTWEAREEHTDTLTKALENYLSEEHRDAPGAGCALGALLGDMSRASRSAKAVYTARLKRTLAYSRALFPKSQL